MWCVWCVCVQESILSSNDDVQDIIFMCVYKWEWLYVFLCECVGVWMCISMLCQMCLFVKKEDDHFYVILFDTCHAL